MRRFSIVTLAAISGFFSAPNAFAIKDGGVGNGGVGVICPNVPVQLLEEYENPGAHYIWDDQAEMKLDVLLKEVRARLRLAVPEVGEGWASLTDFRDVDYQTWKTTKNIRTYDTGLDEKLPNGCSYVQLAYNYKSQFYRVEPYFSQLTMNQKNFIALHESLYRAAVEKMGQNNSVLTRKLNSALVERDFNAGKVRRILKDWGHDYSNPEIKIGFWDSRIGNIDEIKNYHIQGSYKKASGSEKCPADLLIIKSTKELAGIYWWEPSESNGVIRSLPVESSQIRCGSSLNHQLIVTQPIHCKGKTKDFSFEGRFNFGFVGTGSSPSELSIRFRKASACRYVKKAESKTKDDFDQMNLKVQGISDFIP